MGRFVEDISTHRIEDHIGAPAIGNLFYPRGELVGAQRVVCAVSFQFLALPVGARGGDDGGTQQFSQIDRRETHPAAGAMDQHGFSLLQPL